MEISQHTTLPEWMQEWLRIYKLPTIKKRTADVYNAVLKIIVSYPDVQKPIPFITEMDLQQLLNAAAAKNYSKSTLGKIRSTLRQAYRPLLRQKLISVDPTPDLILPLAPTKEVLPLTHEEQAAVEAACSCDPLGHLILFLLETGLRRSEMMELLWENYNPAHHSIFVATSKTPAGIRTVYLTKKAEDIIRQQEHINAYIFNHTHHAPVTITVLRRLVNRIRTASGVSHLTCHVCRHTFVTRLCEQKVPAKAIAQIIGHAKVDYVLDIYAKMEADELRKAIYALDPERVSSEILGEGLNIPTPLYKSLQKEADKQKVSVDALVTHLLTLYITKKA